MNVDDYVSESGRGPYQAWNVPDLVPLGTQPVKLLLVLESPHRDELKAVTPVAGGAGTSALGYLLQAPTKGDSLGAYIRRKHDAGDYRVAIVNVSTVPLQMKAFGTGSRPGLSAHDWDVVRRVRTSTVRSVTGTTCAEANQAGDVLLRVLQAKVDALTLDADCVVAPCGVFAQRFIRELRRLPVAAPLKVVHPARNQWPNGGNHPNLLALRELFALNT
ncbi:hypothetical protein [Cryobacterium sp. Hh38]|uniref:hypothetical protein n=1 Tax=Cryobacterium sp. Hh38 TaxID=1259156 RepID=UPI00106BEC02|nr:hypothetical protein [Cryobacterium sp. Hh38]TFD59593.1 hypothetical protein E3T41_11150 [Cryobacterium sp. Hh38]